MTEMKRSATMFGKRQKLVPIYIINGFLESGKTTFLRDVLQGGDFYDGEPGLLILCD